MAEKETTTKGKKELTDVEVYRQKISCKLTCYIIIRVAIVVLCLVCAGFLTYYVGGFSKQVQINTFGEILMVGFIALAIILAGFIIYRMPLNCRRFQTVLVRLDALILRDKMAKQGGDPVTNLDRELQMIVRILES